MSFKIYLGIDVSKLTLDVFIREAKVHKQFKNNSDGFGLLVKWLEKQTKEPLDSVLVCFEHTGLYSLPLTVFLEEKQIPFSMIPALEIKRSLGVTRGKNDFIDSKRIAEFAYRFKDQTSCPGYQKNPIFADAQRAIGHKYEWILRKPKRNFGNNEKRRFSRTV